MKLSLSQSCFIALCLIIINLSAVCASEKYYPSDFVNSIFNFSGLKEGLYEISITNSSTTMDGQTIMAYGHFNRQDQYANIVTRDKSMKKLNLYISDQDHRIYNLLNDFCNGSNQYCSKDILNVIPVDWDYNGYLDIIIIADDSDNTGGLAFQAHFLLQNPADNILASECNFNSCQLVNDVSSNINSNSQPFLIPLNDQNAHKHGLVYCSKDSLRQVISYNSLSNDASDKLQTELFSTYVDQISEQCQGFTQYELQTKEFAQVHFSSVVDLNGDCRDDLFIHSTTVDKASGLPQDVFEFYVREPNGLYCLVNVQTIPVLFRVEAVGFTDANFDGSIDLVIMYGSSVTDSTSFMQIAFNHIIPSLNDVCSEDNMFSTIYGDLTNLSSSAEDVLIMEYDFKLISASKTSAPSLRFGDFNLDGYNDLLMTVIEKGKEDSYSYFFENTPCDLAECKVLQTSHRRYFKKGGSDSNYDLISQKPSVSASFFDFNENGQLDIILNSETKNADLTTSISATFIYNFMKIDSYFVKAFVMNGYQDGSVGNDYTSSNVYGATVVCKVTTIDEVVRPIKGISLYQSAYSPLQLPYVLMGISRTNSYVSDVTVGIGLTQGAVKSWNPIIPNSQLNIYPYTDDTDNWGVNAFMLNVVQSLLAILIIAACLLISLGIAIYYLFAREKSIDKREIEIENLLI